MAQPTQQLPSWLTLSSTLVTDPDGSVSTSFTTLRLPLTYYGPSVPLGTDGVWTYGGLTPPPSTSTTNPTATPTLTSPPSSTITPAPSTSVPTVSSSASSTPTASTASPPAASHGISVGVLGAILGAILGFLLLVIIFLTLCLIRRNRRRSRNLEGAEPASSSFWNRQTTLASIFNRGDDHRQTPIWTGWEFVSPEDAAESGIPRNGANGRDAGNRTPGEGSPRGSGEEVDPFLTRRSLRNAASDDMTQTKTGTDTLVSVPAAAAVGTPRPSPAKGGHIVPPTELHRLAEQGDEFAFAGIRIVEPSPPSEELSPLVPPNTLDPDGLRGFGIRRPRPLSDRSLASQQGRSVRSEKSGGSLDNDPAAAELLVARRVRVDELNRSHTRLATIESDTEASPSRSALGLSGLGARLGRLSWFKRMSSSGSPPRSPSHAPGSEDTYTRSPPRSVRHGSRPGSRTALLDDADINPDAAERERLDSGLGLGLLPPGGIRPISTLSTNSASGNTIYHSARSRPASSVVDFPTPVTSPDLQRELSRAAAGNNAAFTGSYDMPFAPPPAYEERALPGSRLSRPPSNIDILDMPAPSSVFGTRRPSAPPGLDTMPNPQSWRESASTDPESPGIAIDIEDAPPTADERWRDLAAERDHRRTTFGAVQPQDAPGSEYPSVHSLHSHLRPQNSSSNGSSGNSSGHSQGGSASSRPSGNSPLRSMASAQSLTASSGEGGDDMGELRRPPLSAVFGSFAAAQAQSRPQSGSGLQPPQQPYVTPHSSRAPLLGGTVTSTHTDTNSSVTTALTDPITGAVLHFPALPYRSAAEAATVRRVEYDNDERNEHDHW